MTQDPEAFQLCIDVFVRRYSDLNVDMIAGLDARGFILGPPIALALKKPFVMIRKKGKLPNAVTGAEYFKEYSGENANGGDELCLSRSAIRPGARVLVIDDLVATGGTLIAACDLLHSVGLTVCSSFSLRIAAVVSQLLFFAFSHLLKIVECACIVELKALQGYQKLQAKHPGVEVHFFFLIIFNFFYQIKS